MHTTPVTIGYTVTDRENGYVPALDGYRPGAALIALTFQVPDHLLIGKALEDVAETAFEATNSPDEPNPGTLAYVIASASNAALARSISVGDTVTVGTEIGQDPTVACERFGWKVLEHAA